MIFLCRSGPLIVSEKQISQNGAGIVRKSCVSSAPKLNEMRSVKAELRSNYRWKQPAYGARLATEALVSSEQMEIGPGPQTDAENLLSFQGN